MIHNYIHNYNLVHRIQKLIKLGLFAYTRFWIFCMKQWIWRKKRRSILRIEMSIVKVDDFSG